MNKKSQRHTFHAPTTHPLAAIAPSGTIAFDGDIPHAASNGVAAPEPLAAHDVLHAALAQPDAGSVTTAPDGEHGTTTVDDPGMPADTGAMHTPAQDTDTGDLKAAKGNAHKASKKARQAAALALADPLAAAVAPKVKPLKEKFVACHFTLPPSEAAVLSAMKKTHQANGVNVKKSQLLRAALLHLAELDSSQLAQLVAQLPAPPVSRKKKK